jgi:DMSO/TMAO reductase YedYZ molybdopterin-dependent catalytic subunit
MIISPDTVRQNRVPPGQRLIKNWPVLHYGGVPRISADNWNLRLFGLVEEERNLSYREFLALPRALVLSDVHCVTGWSRLNNQWEGVLTTTLKVLVRIMPDARFAIIHAKGNFTTNLSLEDFFREDVILAISHDGVAITNDHGYPVRLVVPRSTSGIVLSG